MSGIVPFKSFSNHTTAYCVSVIQVKFIFIWLVFHVAASPRVQVVWSGLSNLSVRPPCDSCLSGGGGNRKENTWGQDASILQEEEAQRGLPEETWVSAVPGKKKKLLVLVLTYLSQIHLLTLSYPPQSKEAGADDILDISACGLSEVRGKLHWSLTAIVLWFTH